MHRGKCSVSLLNELEDIRTYLEEEDTFYYSMVYDPNQKTLLVDKGEIRTGPDYQAEIPPYIDPGECVGGKNDLLVLCTKFCFFCVPVCRIVWVYE